MSGITGASEALQPLLQMITDAQKFQERLDQLRASEDAANKATADLAAAKADSDARNAAIEAKIADYVQREKDFASIKKSVLETQAEFDALRASLNERTQAVASEEAKLADKILANNTSLQAKQSELDGRESAVAAREQAVYAREIEISNTQKSLNDNLERIKSFKDTIG